MRFLRALLVPWLVVVVGFAPAVSSAALADPVCMQDSAGHGGSCGGGDVLSMSCSPAASCAMVSVAEARAVSCEGTRAARLTRAVTPPSSLALAPETAPPKHSVL